MAIEIDEIVKFPIKNDDFPWFFLMFTRGVLTLVLTEAPWGMTGAANDLTYH